MPEKNEPNAMDDESKISFLDVAILVCSRKRLIILPTALGALLVFGASLLLVDRFTASTVLIPPTDPLTMSVLLRRFSPLGPLSSFTGNLGIQESGDTDIALLHTRTIQDSLINRFSLAKRYGSRNKDDAREQFRARSKIVLGRKDGLIEIDVEDNDPKLAADLANGYATEFQSLLRSIADSEAKQRKDLLQKQLVEAQKQLATSEAVFVSVQKETGVIELKSQTTSIIQTAFSLRDQVASKEVEIEAMRSYATANNPAMVKAKQELVALKIQLENVKDLPNQSDLGLISAAKDIPLADIRYAQALHELRASEEYFDLVTYMLEAAREDERRHGAYVKIADPATIPDEHTFPQRLIITACATMTVFSFALSAVFMREGIARRSS